MGTIGFICVLILLQNCASTRAGAITMTAGEMVEPLTAEGMGEAPDEKEMGDVFADGLDQHYYNHRHDIEGQEKEERHTLPVDTEQLRLSGLDMLVDEDLLARRERGKNGSRVARSLSADNPWHSGVIAYDLQIDDEGLKGNVENAAAMWNSKTCLNIRPAYQYEKPTLSIFSRTMYDGLCFATVGYHEWETNLMEISNEGCHKDYIMLHEFGHVMGLFHEHNRPDRDGYIVLNTTNINTDSMEQFEIETGAAYYSPEYDYLSIMHYGNRSGSIDHTILSMNTTDSYYRGLIGEQHIPSFLDYKHVNQLYGCADKCQTKDNITCPEKAYLGADCECYCETRGSTGRTLSETIICPPSDGWSDWVNSGYCTVSCGGGLSDETRTCVDPVLGCEGSTTQTVSCNTNPCPANGGWGDWVNSGYCTVSCGGGLSEETRTCVDPVLGCEGSTTQSVSCNTNSCPAVCMDTRTNPCTSRHCKRTRSRAKCQKTCGDCS